MDDFDGKIELQPPVDEEDEPIEAVLTKFVLITEWMDGEGNRYLVRKTGNGMGDAITGWDTKGLLHECLFGADWN